jgi:hypothetical protein
VSWGNILCHRDHLCVFRVDIRLKGGTGPLARIAPNILMTNDASLVKRMNAVRSPYTRSIWYNCIKLHPKRDNIVSYRDEQIHQRLRSQMSHGVSSCAPQWLLDIPRGLL